MSRPSAMHSSSSSSALDVLSMVLGPTSNAFVVAGKLGMCASPHFPSMPSFEEACRDGHLEEAKRLFGAGGVDIHADDDFAFKWAVRREIDQGCGKAKQEWCT